MDSRTVFEDQRFDVLNPLEYEALEPNEYLLQKAWDDSIWWFETMGCIYIMFAVVLVMFCFYLLALVSRLVVDIS